MDDHLVRLALGTLAAGAIAGAAHRSRALSRDGALAAVLVGAAVVTGGGWWWGILVVAFFAGSTALGRLVSRAARTAEHVEELIAARGSRRDAVQVAANGGLAALLALLFPLGEEPILFAAFCGAVGAAAADTWATEVGRLARHPPRLITTGRPVPPGTSGGVTLPGTLGALAGAAAIALLAGAGSAAGWAPRPLPPATLVAAVALAGFAGALVDSLLGATLQAAYRCPACDQPTERRVHRCGTPARLVRGLPVVTNDVVNAAATLTGAAIAAAVG